MVSNPNFYGQSTTGTPNQIEDGVDFPHTGIIKALSLGLGQNYVISGFDLTAGANQYTQVNVSGGVICRDGKIISSGGHLVSGVTNLTMGYTTANGYHLLVVDSSNNIVFRSPSAVDKVPEYSTKDIIIAVVTYKGASTNPDFQYLTFKKAENSVSIAQNTGGSTYTEEGKITAPSGSAGQGIDIVTSTTNSDIRITPNGSGKIVLDGLNWPIADGSANQVLKTDGGGQLSFVNAYADADAVSAIETEAGLDFSTSSNDAIIENTTQDKDIILKINDGGTATEVMRIDGDVAKVGIGTATPAEKLSVSGNIRSSGDVIVGGALDHNGSNISFFATAAATKQTVGNMGTTAVQATPAVDPTATPGFEAGNTVYLQSLESEISNLRTKMDALIDALQLYGLIS